MSFTIDMSALDDFLQRIDDLQRPDVFAQISRKASQAAGVEAEKGISPYPPKRNPASKYKRTGTLGKSISSSPFLMGGVSGFFIGTNVKYAPRVIGSPQQQAAVNRDWWTPLAHDIYDNMPAIADAYRLMFVAETNRYLRGL